MVSLSILLNPVPASRPRVTRRGFSYYAEPYKTFKKELGAAFKSLYKGPLHTLPVEVRILIVGKRPKSTKLPFPKPDVDNYAKAVLDAMNGVVLQDDSLVKRLEVAKEWAEVGETGRVVVNVL